MLAFFSNTAARVRRDEKGATAVEYGIMVALIAVVIIAAVTLIGGNLKGTFESVGCSVKGGTYTAAKDAVPAGSDGTGGSAAVASSCSKA
ncbi:Flp family type IVb pilin [Pseudarthrobacter sp. NamB4]|uniref:Flp family type IVb pilin n=1 Tax=Pseudarthrobacter sp. NamB4 TaxID=2576837 RepID=UPI0010FE5EE7|nr:Flp family type IVb pilin [Pseudarthrobacter sp. NamB4]TLM74709.1 Flp family type IVb pilin [Pseudarthrobacter sp. NamB4]